MARKKPRIRAPESEYRDPEHGMLLLRGSLTPATRRQYAEVASGSPLSREDAWQRAVEFLFERLAVRWTVAGLPLERQDELVGRYRMASQQERAWIRRVLREHVAEPCPDVEAH